MKKLLRKMLPDSWFKSIKDYYWNYLDGSSFKSYSSEGEDMILRKIFYKKKKGFYVDVGAFHPKKASNTYFFYKIGWSGINIDAMPGSMELFKKIRPRDINLECPIGNEREKVTYYEFEDKALNGFENDRLQAKDQLKTQNKLVGTHLLNCISLNSILKENLPEGQEIDFLSIDVEGNELTVLEGLDLSKFRPRIILVEILDFDFSNSSHSPVFLKLISMDYYPYLKTLNTVFFKC